MAFEKMTLGFNKSHKPTKPSSSLKPSVSTTSLSNPEHDSLQPISTPNTPSSRRHFFGFGSHKPIPPLPTLEFKKSFKHRNKPDHKPNEARPRPRLITPSDQPPQLPERNLRSSVLMNGLPPIFHFDDPLGLEDLPVESRTPVDRPNRSNTRPSSWLLMADGFYAPPQKFSHDPASNLDQAHASQECLTNSYQSLNPHHLQPHRNLQPFSSSSSVSTSPSSPSNAPDFRAVLAGYQATSSKSIEPSQETVSSSSIPSKVSLKKVESSTPVLSAAVPTILNLSPRLLSKQAPTPSVSISTPTLVTPNTYSPLAAFLGIHKSNSQSGQPSSPVTTLSAQSPVTPLLSAFLVNETPEEALSTDGAEHVDPSSQFSVVAPPVQRSPTMISPRYDALHHALSCEPQASHLKVVLAPPNLSPDRSRPQILKPQLQSSRALDRQDHVIVQSEPIAQAPIANRPPLPLAPLDPTFSKVCQPRRASIVKPELSLDVERFQSKTERSVPMDHLITKSFSGAWLDPESQNPSSTLPLTTISSTAPKAEIVSPIISRSSSSVMSDKPQNKVLAGTSVVSGPPDHPLSPKNTQSQRTSTLLASGLPRSPISQKRPVTDIYETSPQVSGSRASSVSEDHYGEDSDHATDSNFSSPTTNTSAGEMPSTPTENSKLVKSPGLEDALLSFPGRILAGVLARLEYLDFFSLMLVSSRLRDGLASADLKEVVLERYLGQLGYRRAFTHNEPINLRDLQAFYTGLEFGHEELAQLARQLTRLGLDLSTVKMIREASRAHNRIVMHIRSNGGVSRGPILHLGQRLDSVWKPGRTVVLKVWVPTKESWMNNQELIECERELCRSQVWSQLRRGDVCWNTAVGDFGNEGKLIYDGKYLRDLSFVFDAVGHLPTWLNMLSFSPAYYHNIIAASTPTPIFYLDLSAFARQVQDTLRLCKDKIEVASPQARYRVQRWVYRAIIYIKPGLITGGSYPTGGRKLGPVDTVHPQWVGQLVIEVEGTSEHAQELMKRCSREWSLEQDELQRKRSTKASIDTAREPAQVHLTPWRIVRERSGPGKMWIRPVYDDERI